MILVPSFVELLQPLQVVMTVPTFDNLLTILGGWVYARRRTVTGMIVAAGAVGRKHHSTFHRLFASASWSLDALGLAVFALIEPWLDTDAAVMLALDDTLARKRGVKMFGVGMHHDPLISSRKTAVVNWGHSWVVLTVLVKFPFCDRRCFALPILLRLYLNKNAADKAKRAYRTRPQLAVRMFGVLCSTYKNRRFHVIADSAYPRGWRTKRVESSAGQLRPDQPTAAGRAVVRPGACTSTGPARPTPQARPASAHPPTDAQATHPTHGPGYLRPNRPRPCQRC